MTPRSALTALASCAAAFVLPLAGATAASAGATDAESATGDGNRVPGQVVVKFERDASVAARSAARADAGTVVIERSAMVDGLQLLEVEPGEAVSDAVERLEADRGVVHAEPNFTFEPDAAPNDPFYQPFLWGMHNVGQVVSGSAGVADADIDAPEAWNRETGSAQTVVAVVDTGVDMTHPDLADNIWTNPGETGSGRETNGVDDDANGFVDDWRGWDFGNADNDPSDEQWMVDGADKGGHGTHVAGTIGAEGDNSLGVVGVNWDVQLMSVKTFPAATSYTVADSLYYAGNSGADVVNASFSGSGFSELVHWAISQHPGTLFVTGAGNDGLDGDASKRYPCAYNLPNVICVAATGHRDQLADFSNYGDETVDLGAPGVNIGSTAATYRRPDDPYMVMSGTSMATPMVAGAAGILVSRWPEASAGQLRDALLGGVDPVTALNGKTVTGGRLNLDHALDRLDLVTPPDTKITSGPTGTVRADSASFEFTGTLGPTGFECRLDAGPWGACSSPHQLAGLSQGEHTFEVRALKAVGADATPASRTWTFDPTAPVEPAETTITSGPRRVTTQRPRARAAFGFTGQNVSSFECRLDRGEWGACTSPRRLSVAAKPKRTSHTFAVRALNSVGEPDATPATRSFTVKRLR
ncbi:S8 family serine peptidase [Thermoleophilia bacterium SCSIO 60948]|nr:S8 family serine peptidase [Thermoleophilia bacterium SCSIO 60948]